MCIVGAAFTLPYQHIFFLLGDVGSSSISLVNLPETRNGLTTDFFFKKRALVHNLQTLSQETNLLSLVTNLGSQESLLYVRIGGSTYDWIYV